MFTTYVERREEHSDDADAGDARELVQESPGADDVSRFEHVENIYSVYEPAGIERIDLVRSVRYRADTTDVLPNSLVKSVEKPGTQHLPMPGSSNTFIPTESSTLVSNIELC
jgi:hypothetical protein